MKNEFQSRYEYARSANSFQSYIKETCTCLFDFVLYHQAFNSMYNEKLEYVGLTEATKDVLKENLSKTTFFNLFKNSKKYSSKLTLVQKTLPFL